MRKFTRKMRPRRLSAILGTIIALSGLIGCSAENISDVVDAISDGTQAIEGSLDDLQDLAEEGKEYLEDYQNEYSFDYEENDSTGTTDDTDDSDPGEAVDTTSYTAASLDDIPDYSGTPYVEINENVPYFEEDEITTEVFETYSELDDLGRCGVAYANICQNLMPTEERGDISSVHPSGWTSGNDPAQWNRCHLIGFQLAGENDNELNLITGTRYMNVDGMLPFENEIADYVDETDNHVLYRVTPIYDGDNLVASGVEMEALSVEDDGEGVCFNIYCYNVQPGVVIDYATGESWDVSY